MTLITRTGKGSKLTIAEMDGNLTYLESAIPSYRVYTAVLTQTGTDAPVATVLENTLGGDVVWSYDSTGEYFGTLIGAFTDNQTYFSALPAQGIQLKLIRGDNDRVNLGTILALDNRKDNNLLSKIPIEIRVYN